MNSQEKVAAEQSGDGRGPRRPFPRHTLEDALQVAQAIQDANNGQPMNRLLLADAMGRTPSSSAFRDLISSSYKYGLTEGTEKAPQISLTPDGRAATRPLSPAERSAALVRAAATPAVFKAVYQRYDSGRLPQGSFFANVLEREFSVPRPLVGECANLIVQNGKFVGIIKEVGGSPHVILSTAEPATEPGLEVPSPTSEEPPLPSATEGAAPEPGERQIFIGHGKNRTPLDQLERVLRQFNIPYKVATEEPNRGRPISQKVADVMRECRAAILLFTCDEEFTEPGGNQVWRPSENVGHELGAASVLYGNKIVIFKEEGIDLPTNFRDIGYISFEKDKLEAKGLDLIKELLALGFLKVTV